MGSVDGERRQTLTVEEVGRVLGIGRQLAYDQVRAGLIPALRLGQRWVVPRAALEAWLAEPGTTHQIAAGARSSPAAVEGGRGTGAPGPRP